MAFQKILKISSVFVILLTSLYLNTSCKHESSVISELDSVCFETQVLPIFQTSCGKSGCHSSSYSSEQFPLTSYNDIIKRVVPGDPRNSEVYVAITSLYAIEFMPPDAPLDQSQRNIIQLWISQGAKNTQCNLDSNGLPPIPPPPPVFSDTLCFNQVILPMISSNCATAKCHDIITHKEDYVLDNYTSIIKIVKKGNAADSKIYKVVTIHNNTGEDDERMPPPPRPPLTPTQIDQLAQWINEGAVNSDCQNMNCDTTNAISFSSQVFPVLNLYCVGCHNSTYTSGSVNLSDYNNIKKTAEILREGNISILVGAIRHSAGFKPMPPSGALDECTIRQIELWIEQDKLNN